nr:replication protein A 70 kDa DNA-binding subunit D-like [Ipomoea batatas]
MHFFSLSLLLGTLTGIKVEEHPVLESNSPPEKLNDLIGRVVSITEPKVIQVNSNLQRLIDFVIEDSQYGTRLTITLWDEHVDSMLPYYNADLADPLIIILHLCTTRMNDDGEVRISSSYIVTKILFNYECPEFPNFKERCSDISLLSLCIIFYFKHI